MYGVKSTDIEDFQPSLAFTQEMHNEATAKTTRPNLLPISISISSDFLTPITVFLKLSSGYESDYNLMPRPAANSCRATTEYCFLLESATGSSETIGRYSYIG